MRFFTPIINGSAPPVTRRGLKSFGARDFSPENSSDEGLKSLAPTKTVARQTPIWRSGSQAVADVCGGKDSGEREHGHEITLLIRVFGVRRAAEFAEQIHAFLIMRA